MDRASAFAIFWRAVLALSALVSAPMASAAPLQHGPPPIFPGHACVHVSETAEDPTALMARPKAFDCSAQHRGLTARYTWGLIRGLDLVTNPHDPWEVRHEYSQADAETMFVRYADGAIVHAPSDRMSARRLFSPGMVSFALPAREGRITDILIGVKGLQNQRGVAPGLMLATGNTALQGDIVVLFLYGVLGGTIVALFAYNFALFLRLRYRFILSYCLSSLAMLFMGVCWSGGIFALFPDMDTTTQISLTMLGTSTVLGTGALFLRTFVEKRFLPKWPMRLTFDAAMIAVGSSIVRLIDPHLAWRLMDQLTYGAIGAVLVGLLITSAIGARRGSRSARIYLIAWTIPIVLGLARTIWAVNLIGFHSVLIAMSPLIFMSVEALMSALAVSWRIGGLRNERDEARAIQAQLRHFAEIDALTGLHNRRAFIERAAQSHGVQRLILIDIDQFKQVNDRFGHIAGDEVLAAVAAVLRHSAPDEAPVGRLGGEEFAVLIPASPVDALADRLCKAVAATVHRDGLTVTISAGVADGKIADDADWRRIYHAADQALYRAKNGGRNRVSHAPRPIAA